MLIKSSFGIKTNLNNLTCFGVSCNPDVLGRASWEWAGVKCGIYLEQVENSAMSAISADWSSLKEMKGGRRMARHDFILRKNHIKITVGVVLLPTRPIINPVAGVIPALVTRRDHDIGDIYKIWMWLMMIYSFRFLHRNSLGKLAGHVAQMIFPSRWWPTVTLSRCLWVE